MNDYNLAMGILFDTYPKIWISEFKQAAITQILHLQHPELDPEEIASAVFDYFPDW